MAYGTRRFNAASTRTLKQSLSWADSTQLLVLIPISLRSILILSSHHVKAFPKVFPVGLPVKIIIIIYVVFEYISYLPEFCVCNYPHAPTLSGLVTCLKWFSYVGSSSLLRHLKYTYNVEKKKSNLESL